jgi:hypothetical protein
VTFQWRDYRAQQKYKSRVMTVSADEFIRRFLMHSLPPGFQRIRHFGFLANRFRKQKLALYRTLLSNPVMELLPNPAQCRCSPGCNGCAALSVSTMPPRHPDSHPYPGRLPVAPTPTRLVMMTRPLCIAPAVLCSTPGLRCVSCQPTRAAPSRCRASLNFSMAASGQGAALTTHHPGTIAQSVCLRREHFRLAAPFNPHSRPFS